jgi:hypothetical protein
VGIEMKLVVVHDGEGEIVSVARVHPADVNGPGGGVGAWPERGHRAVELDVPDEVAELEPSEIAERYRLDTRAGELTARSESGS